EAPHGPGLRRELRPVVGDADTNVGGQQVLDSAVPMAERRSIGADGQMGFERMRPAEPERSGAGRSETVVGSAEHDSAPRPAAHDDVDHLMEVVPGRDRYRFAFLLLCRLVSQPTRDLTGQPGARAI